jgi:hypothetical protein
MTAWLIPDGLFTTNRFLGGDLESGPVAFGGDEDDGHAEKEEGGFHEKSLGPAESTRPKASGIRFAVILRKHRL